MDVVIREGALTDQAGIDLLYAEIDALHHQAMSDQFRSSEEMTRSSTYLAERLADEQVYIYVAEVTGRLAGIILMKIRSQEHYLLFPQTYLHVSTLVVAAEFQGQGVAQRLMATAVTIAQERQLNQIRLNVYEFNQRAIAFYEKEGFVTGSRQMWLNL